MTPTAHPHAVVNEVMWHKPQFSPCFPFKWEMDSLTSALCCMYIPQKRNGEYIC